MSIETQENWCKKMWLLEHVEIMKDKDRRPSA